MQIYADTDAVVSADGNVTWPTPALVTSTCAQDAANYPFDIQVPGRNIYLFLDFFFIHLAYCFVLVSSYFLFFLLYFVFFLLPSLSFLRLTSSSFSSLFSLILLCSSFLFFLRTCLCRIYFTSYCLCYAFASSYYVLINLCSFSLLFFFFFFFFFFFSAYYSSYSSCVASFTVLVFFFRLLRSCSCIREHDFDTQFSNEFQEKRSSTFVQWACTN